MKLLCCIVVVILNISTNGKASIDSLIPSVSNALLEDSTIKSEHSSCYRPCKFNVKPRRCHYVFKVAPIFNDEGKPVIAINDFVPGPAINVCQNDIIVVEVQNKIPDQDLAIHWHGIEQVGTSYMDGVPMVTQCPINYGATYKYAFRASKPGTFFYAAHSVSHQTDGVFGALIVNQPSPLEFHSSLYDYDRSIENTLVMSAIFPKLFTGSLEDLSQIKPTSFRVNGEESYEVFMNEKFAYRLRLVNAIAIDCPLSLSVEDHELTVIATDSTPVKPVSTKKVILYPGERMDVVLKANERPGRYSIHINGHNKCNGIHATATVMYTGGNYTSLIPNDKKLSYPVEVEFDDVSVYGQMLQSIKDDNNSASTRSLYLSIDRNTIAKDVENDFRYISDAIPQKPFIPVALSQKQTGVVQINAKNFLYPNALFLTQQREVSKKLICPVGDEVANGEPQCIQTVQGAPGEVLELVLINEGVGSTDSYTFHIHGHKVQVLETHQQSVDKPLLKSDFLRLDQDGKIKRNTINPPLKDTIFVPNKGYTIIRMKLDNPGSWLMECRSCVISSLPAAILINVPQTIPKSVTDSLPKCGNYRPPDVLLH